MHTVNTQILNDEDNHRFEWLGVKDGVSEQRALFVRLMINQISSAPVFSSDNNIFTKRC